MICRWRRFLPAAFLASPAPFGLAKALSTETIDHWNTAAVTATLEAPKATDIRLASLFAAKH
jgi:hypothetical protein